MKSILVILFLARFGFLMAQNSNLITELGIEKVNEIRKETGAKPLVRDSRLDSAAAMQARWCAETDILSHSRPKGRFRTVEDRFKAVKYKSDYSGENILYFMPDEDQSEESLAAEMIQQWRDSPGHYANMKSKAYVETGLAIAWNAEGDKLYACQTFGKQAKSKKRN